MHDINKLPKWARDRLETAERNQNIKNTGADVQNCVFENVAVKHDQNSAEAIRHIADALGRNADALKELAKSMSGSGVEVEFGPGLHLSHINTPNQ